MVNQQLAGHPAIAQDSNSEWVMPRIESLLQAPGSLGPSNHCHDVVNFPSPWVPRNPSLIQTSQQKNTGKWAIQPTEMASFSPFLTLFTNLEGKFQDPRPPTSHRQAAHPLRSMLHRRGRASHPGHPWAPRKFITENLGASSKWYGRQYSSRTRQVFYKLLPTDY